MLTLLIGHRGVGKTTLCRKLSSLLPNWQTADLDDLITQDSNQSTQALFANGENCFREQEMKSFHKHCLPLIDANSPHVVSLGGGFPNNYLIELKKKHPNIRIIWLRRKSDDQARFEGNRPALKQDILRTWELRKKSYEQACDEVLYLPEGPFWPKPYCDFLTQFFDQKLQIKTPLVQTLPESESKELVRKARFLFQKRLGVELRNDLQCEMEMLEFLQSLSCLEMPEKNNILISLRRGPQPDFLSKLFAIYKSELKSRMGYKLHFDCDLEIWEKVADEVSKLSALNSQIDLTLSLHSYGPAESQLKDFEKAVHVYQEHKTNLSHIKWAPSVENLHTLRTLWEKLKSCELRDAKTSFLPRGPSGFGKFFRLLTAECNRFNFCHSYLADDSSQPTLWENWTQQNNSEGRTAASWRAVLGADTQLSWSPLFHNQWSEKRGEKFLNLSLKESPSNDELGFLLNLGLKGLAITSPFKVWAAKSSKHAFANTWTLSASSFVVENTDIVALKKLLPQSIHEKSVLIFGKGAIGKQLAELLPHATCVGLRELEAAQLKNTDTCLSKSVDFVIWAASPLASFHGLPENPETVWDMNYFEHSQAQTYAKAVAAEYISGQQFFEEQGRLQQVFWTHE